MSIFNIPFIMEISHKIQTFPPISNFFSYLEPTVISFTEYYEDLSAFTIF